MMKMISPYNSFRKAIKKITKFILLCIVILIIAFPIYWTIATSFKPQLEWVTFPPMWIPKEPTILNYLLIIYGIPGYRARPFPSALPAYLNSLIVSGASTLLGVIVSILAAYATSRFKLGQSFLISALMPRMFPPMAMIIPMLVYFNVLGLTNNYLGFILIYTGFMIPYSILMLKGFMDAVPKELIEAAILDGLSDFKILRKIYLPMVKSGLLPTALFLFILNWTEYAFAMSLFPKIETVPVTLAKLFSNEAGMYYGPQAALGILAIIPPIIIGLLIRKYLAYGFTFGAIKK
ncbi:MAG: carbohydrate ABC transporter permease [Nitrososphaerota archaeon]|nr:carbohydrate ABC transporter permease [Nitrososphaerota archaeon]